MDFRETFANYSNLELLRIIENADSYQPAARIVAMEIYNGRFVSFEEENQLREQLHVEEQEKFEQERLSKESAERIKAIGNDTINKINPMRGKTYEDRVIRSLCFVLTLAFLFRVIEEFSLTVLLIQDISNADATIIIYFFAYLFLPVTIPLFFLRKKIGWQLMAIYLTYSAASELAILIIGLTNDYSYPDSMSENFPATLTATHLLKFIFYLVPAIAICRESIRDIYGISFQVMARTVLITVFIVILTMFGAIF